MLIKLENNQNLNQILKDNHSKPVLIDFYADWCPPCRMLSPVLDSIEKKYGDEFTIIKVNVDHFPELSAQYQVKSIPALFYLKNEEIQTNSLGFIDENSLVNKLRSI
ncbi:thioredoxin [Ureaplasma parvum]|nr:thioredoxin [Ureaplasma parvum]